MLAGCGTSTAINPTKQSEKTIDQSLLSGCEDWLKLKEVTSNESMMELKINRVNHQRCYLKWKGLVEAVTILNKTNT